MAWIICSMILFITVKIVIDFSVKYRMIRKNKNLLNLVLLRMELVHPDNMFPVGSEDLQDIESLIDRAFLTILEKAGLKPGTDGWKARRQKAWEFLSSVSKKPIPVAPWAPAVNPLHPATADRFPAIDTTGASFPSLQQSVDIEAENASSGGHMRKETPPPLPFGYRASPASKPAKQLRNHRNADESEKNEAVEYAWKPVPPGKIERAFESFCNGSKRILPFLVQNTGWFISGIFLIAGFIFLAAYTAGFTRSLVISVSLFTLTFTLMFGAYKLLARRPDLKTPAKVMLCLGMFLIPLSLASSVRLVMTEPASGVSTMIALFVVLVNFVVFYGTSQVASGIMDKALRGKHPLIFMAISGVQLAVIFISHMSFWPLLSLLHICVLVLLGIGIRAFVQKQIQSIFVNRYPTSGYAVGTLFYAAGVSFIHLTASFQDHLPPGYFGPFLMILVGMLFYMDAHLKQWANKYTFFSRLTIGIYALSLLAVFLSWDTSSTRIITLTIGAGVYASIVRRYLSLSSMNFLLADLAALYAMTVLKHVSFSAYFSVSLPAMAILVMMAVWCIKRRALQCAVLLLRAFSVISTLLFSFSMIHSDPGWGAMFTVLSATAIVYAFLRWLPVIDPEATLSSSASNIAGIRTVDMRQSLWFYAVFAGSALAIAFMPVIIEWHDQFSMGLGLLGCLYTAVGLKYISRQRTDNQFQPHFLFLNSAIVFSVGSVIVAFSSFQAFSHSAQMIFALISAAAVFLIQSLTLRIKLLFYCALIFGGATGAFIRYRYFPGLSTGFLETIGAYAGYGVICKIEALGNHAAPDEKQVTSMNENRNFQFKILHFLEPGHEPIKKLIYLPIQQAMIIFAIISMYRLVEFLAGNGPTFMWIANSSLFWLLGAILFIRFSLIRFWFLPVTMGMIILLSLPAVYFGYQTVWMLSISAFYAVFVQATIFRMRRAPVDYETVMNTLHLSTPNMPDKHQLEKHTHQTALAISCCSAVFAFFHWMAYPVFWHFYTTLLCLIFFTISVCMYRKALYAWPIPGVLILTVVMLFCKVFNPEYPLVLLFDYRINIVLSLTGIAMTLLSRILSQRDCHNGALEKLFISPTAYTGIILAIITGFQGFCIAINNLYPHIGPAFGLGFSGLAMLLSKLRYGRKIYYLMGVFYLSFCVLIIQYSSFITWPLFFFLPGDRCLSLSLLCLAMGVLPSLFSFYIPKLNQYAVSVKQISLLYYTWAIIEAVNHFIKTVVFRTGSGYEPAIFLTLAVASFFVIDNRHIRKHVRGIFISLLLSGAVLTFVFISGTPLQAGFTTIIWSYFLWAAGNLFMPINSRWKQWKIDFTFWPWLGLLLLIICPVISFNDPFVYLNKLYGLVLFAYFLLIMGNSSVKILPWAASGILSFNGILWTLYLFNSDSAGFSIGILLWANGMITCATLWKNTLEKHFIPEAWKKHNLATPLRFFAFFLSSGITLAVLLLNLSITIELNRIQMSFISLFLSASLSVVTFYHLYRTRPTVLYAHWMLTALFSLFLIGHTYFMPAALSLPFIMSTWTVLYLTAYLWMKTASGDFRMVQWLKALSTQLTVLPWLTVFVLICSPVKTLSQTITVLGLTGLVMAVLGLKQQKNYLIRAAQVLLLIMVHTWPAAFVPSQPAAGLRMWQIWPLIIAKLDLIRTLLPWYALQIALISWLIIGFRYLCLKIGKKPAYLESFLFQTRSLLILAISEWLMHVLFFIHDLNPMPPENALIQAIGSLASSILIILLIIRRLFRYQHPGWVYITATLAGITCLYIRLLITGIAMVTASDTGVIICSAFISLAIYRLSTRQFILSPLYHIIYVLPILALFTILHLPSSAHCAAAMTASGALYFSLARSDHRLTTHFLGILFLNGAIYIWIPLWADRMHLLQIYVLPLAMSILLITRLHKNEIDAGVINGSRLIAICLLYGTATIDVFLKPELWVFILAILVSLTGTVIGIMKRIRVFFYGGFIFMLLNITGQLIRFYPQEQLGRGIVLVGLGAVIMSAMIWFNIRRETISQRIRVFRADLESWA